MPPLNPSFFSCRVVREERADEIYISNVLQWLFMRHLHIHNSFSVSGSEAAGIEEKHVFRPSFILKGPSISLHYHSHEPLTLAVSRENGKSFLSTGWKMSCTSSLESNLELQKQTWPESFHILTNKRMRSSAGFLLGWLRLRSAFIAAIIICYQLILEWYIYDKSL